MSATVGDRIRELRKARKLNQDELAELALLNRVTVAKYEAGRVEPGAQALSRLADALEVSVDELLGRSEEDEVFGSQTKTPQTLEARIVSFGMDRLPKDEREKILSILQTMYNNNPDIFKKQEGDHE